MNFRKRDIGKTTRNGELYINSRNISNSNSNTSSGGGTVIGGNYLPATQNEDGTYTVDLSTVYFNGNVISSLEVTAFGSGTTSELPFYTKEEIDTKLENIDIPEVDIDTTNLFKNYGGANVDFNFLDGNNNNGIYYIHSDYTQNNKPFPYGSLLNLSSGVGSWQLAVDASNNIWFRSVWWQGNGYKWPDWVALSKDGHTHSNYSLTSHTHSAYSLTSHTHSAYSLTSHTHSAYSLTSHTHSLSDLTSTAHTHPYAGSSSAGGAATSANKLNVTNKGGATQPVYFKDGLPLACTAYSAASVNYATSCGTAATATTANKLNVTDKGGATQPVYFKDGLPLVCTSYANASVNYANSAGSATNATSATTASKLSCGTVGSATQPIYFSNGVPVTATSYANASVNYANSAGNADTLDGYHGSSSNTVNTYVLRGSSGQINVGAITCGAITSSSNIYASGEVTAKSDKKFKTDIKPLEVRGELNPVTFTMDNKQSIGFIAQEVEEVYPELVQEVTQDGDTFKTLNYQKLTAVLYAEIQALKTKITDLEKRLQ